MATLEALDNEIAELRAQISSLQSHRANLSHILLSTPQLSQRVDQRPVTNESQRRKATKVVKKITNHNCEQTYRSCAGITAYKVQDPDPYAVDSGNILGIRIDVSIQGKFVDAYHVLFNRPDPSNNNVLQIHKHTIPPCIPLELLRNKFMPVAHKEGFEGVEQDLVRFGKFLRRELVSWHLRSVAVDQLRKEAGLPDAKTREKQEMEKYPVGKVLNEWADEESDRDEEEEDWIEDEERNGRQDPLKITDIDANLPVTQISVTWSNGNTAIMKITKDGRVEKGVVRSRNGARVSELGEKVVGRIEGLIERLTA
ncbi:hypothetical protein CC78DRAFT_532472 [Lojkania enalia]|uniref:Cenp-O kinetochore centromere component n=1 Tax=Lojkania enalia TaxID=147567 RepID=A0A9P4K9W6_9PLEO|nr:hypothetical protein CC78DRAFT_532472 [Didymosphaeria enalia]